MATGITIPFTLNPREFLRGLSLIERELGQLPADFRKVESAGDKSAESIEAAFDGLGRQVEAEVDRAQRALRNLDTTTPDLTRTATGVKGKARILGAETGQEFIESWGEAVRAGRPGDAIGETLTNAGMIGMAAGPVGAAIGLGVALAGGVIAGLDKGREQVTKAAASLFADVTGAELAGKEAAQAFLRGYTDAASVGGRLVEVLGVDDVVEAWDRVGRAAQQTGLDADTVAQAFLGGRDALLEVATAQQANAAAYEILRDQAGVLWDTDRERALELLAQAELLTDQAGVMSDITEQGERTADANKRAADALTTQERALEGIAADTGTAAAAAVTGADAAERWAAATAGTAAQARAARDALAQARWEVDQIPRSVTINVLNKLSASGLQP